MIYVIGLLYAIFWLKEIKVPVTSEEDQVAAEEPGGEVARTNGNSGMDNMGFQDAPPASSSDNAENKDKNGQSNGNHRKDGDAADEGQPRRNCCREFFDPTLALGCIQVVRKKRDHLKHIIIWLLIVSYIIIAGTAQGKLIKELIGHFCMSRCFVYILNRWSGIFVPIYSSAVELEWSGSVIFCHFYYGPGFDW